MLGNIIILIGLYNSGNTEGKDRVNGSGKW
jgi:hypothetical protein